MITTESASSSSLQRFAILGGGISGIAAALRLEELRPDVSIVLFESQDRLGGILGTSREAGYLIEQAADNFLRGPTAPWAEQLTRRLELSDLLIPTNEANRGAHVGWHGNLYPVPAGFQLMAPSRFLPILESRLLSIAGKLRLCCEPFIREPRDAVEESLREFATRRLGREAFERLVEPLVAGIYTGDPDRLSIQAALPQMVQMVRDHGSLFKAMRHRNKQSQRAGEDRGARYSLFVAPREGMSSWVNALAGKLKRTDMRLRSRVSSIRKSPDGNWQVEMVPQSTEDPRRQTESFDGVIVALPAPRASDVLQVNYPGLSRALQAIPVASSAVVCLGYRQDQIRRALDAFGCVVPSLEKRKSLAISYSSVKFPDRAPIGSHLLRVFMGGSLHPELAALPDADLEKIARDEVAHWLHVSGSPQFVRVVRWLDAMPQYELGHLQKIDALQQQLAAVPGLALAGNYLKGVGVPQCVRSGSQAAEAILSAATGRTSLVT